MEPGKHESNSLTLIIEENVFALGSKKNKDIKKKKAKPEEIGAMRMGMFNLGANEGID
jgi:hypothetical protein